MQVERRTAFADGINVGKGGTGVFHAAYGVTPECSLDERHVEIGERAAGIDQQSALDAVDLAAHDELPPAVRLARHGEFALKALQIFDFQSRGGFRLRKGSGRQVGAIRLR